MNTQNNFLDKYLSSINNFKVLNKTEEDSLLLDFKINNNKDSFSAVIESNLKLISVISKTFLDIYDDLWELIQEGNLILSNAIIEYELDFKHGFKTYLKIKINLGLKVHIVKQRRIASHYVSDYGCEAFTYLLRDNNSTNHSTDFIKSISSKTQISNKAINTIAQTIDMSDHYSGIQNDLTIESYDEEIYGNEQALLENNSEYRYFNFVDINSQNNLENKKIKEEVLCILEKNKHSFKDREYKILKSKLHYDNSTTLEETGKVFGCTRERVRQIEIKALEKIKLLIENKPIPCTKRNQQDSFSNNITNSPLNITFNKDKNCFLLEIFSEYHLTLLYPSATILEPHKSKKQIYTYTAISNKLLENSSYVKQLKILKKSLILDNCSISFSFDELKNIHISMKGQNITSQINNPKCNHLNTPYKIQSYKVEVSLNLLSKKWISLFHDIISNLKNDKSLIGSQYPYINDTKLVNNKTKNNKLITKIISNEKKLLAQQIKNAHQVFTQKAKEQAKNDKLKLKEEQIRLKENKILRSTRKSKQTTENKISPIFGDKLRSIAAKYKKYNY